MTLATRGRTRAVLGALAVLAALAAWDAVQLQRAHALNALLAAPALPPERVATLDDQAPALRFAHAHALAANGQLDAALKVYRSLQGDPRLAQAARYNAATVLLQQAIDVRSGQQPGQAIPLIELAKEIYREVLREDPGHWDARYNLERAQRLLPDPDDQDQEPGGTPEAAERAATTMRGVSPGLP